MTKCQAEERMGVSDLSFLAISARCRGSAPAFLPRRRIHGPALTSYVIVCVYLESLEVSTQAFGLP